MYKALILDDESLFRQYTRSVLDWEKLGFCVFEAENGKTALEIVRQEQIDLVLADINMPVMNGIEFGKRAKEIKKDICIVIISGYNEFEFAKKAIQIGVNDYILKPFDKDEINEVIVKIKNDLDSRYGISGIKKNSTKQNIMAEKVKKYIDTNFTRSDLTVSEIALKCCVDSSYIRRVFKRAFNTSITDYILDLRMKRAKELLKENKLKLSGICEKVGFEDYNYFSRVFKKYYGVSPKIYEINSENISSHE